MLLASALLLTALLPGAVLAQSEQPSEASASGSGIGYKTVAEALDAVKAKPGAVVTVTRPDSWTIVSEPGGMVVWSFTPSSHAAYPAVVRRAIVVGLDGMARIETTGLCQASKEPCDKLMKDFQELTNKSTKAIRERAKN